MTSEAVEIQYPNAKRILVDSAESDSRNKCSAQTECICAASAADTDWRTSTCYGDSGDNAYHVVQQQHDVESCGTQTKDTVDFTKRRGSADADEDAVKDAKKQESVAEEECCCSGRICTWYHKMQTNKTVLKLVFTISVASILVLAYSLVVVPWLLPYYFTVSAPILIVQRAIRYWKLKWQPFLLDFCYFGNIGLIVFLWAFPALQPYFAVVFGAVNGPMAIAAILFRNSLVFHDADRMTSVFIHVIPMYVTYVIRWYPQQASEYWYTSFVSNFIVPSIDPVNSTVTASFITTTSFDMLYVWVVAVPLTWFTLHSAVYGLVENLCVGEEYLTCYRYLIADEKSWVYKVLTLGGRRKTPWLFMFFQWLYALIGILLARLWYQYFVAHTAFLFTVSLWMVWNGASYYIEVFGKKGLQLTT